MRVLGNESVLKMLFLCDDIYGLHFMYRSFISDPI